MTTELAFWLIILAASAGLVLGGFLEWDRKHSGSRALYQEVIRLEDENQRLRNAYWLVTAGTTFHQQVTTAGALPASGTVERSRHLTEVNGGMLG
jgi:hypothetical protein